MLRTQSKNARNFHFVTTRHLEEEPVLRSHKFNRFEQQKLWNLAIKTKMVMQINRSSFLDRRSTSRNMQAAACVVLLLVTELVPKRKKIFVLHLRGCFHASS